VRSTLWLLRGMVTGAMDTGGRRRSDNFEDRGRGSSGGGGGGIPLQLLSTVVSVLGFKGTLLLGGLAGLAYLVLPREVTQQILGGGTESGPTEPGTTRGPGACSSSPASAQACDFSRAVLASTEDVWTAVFQAGALPSYGAPPTQYVEPTLVVFESAVSTGGCGDATSDVGPFYCPADHRLYLDPGFYQTMERQLRAPGDFAQAYVIAHEVGHHVQNLLGSNKVRQRGETKNQTSVRLELQADCLAGVWGHSARASLAISAEDLREATNAAHNIGDDALGHSNEQSFTHGSSAQRMRWFQRGFDSGDARQCDTFDVSASQL
jgi:uncharacterized protein